MRDLSQMRLSGDPARPRIYKRFLRVVAFLVIVGVVLVFAKSKIGISNVSGGAVVLQEAPKGLQPVKLTGDLDIASEGTDLTSQTVTLRDVKYGGEAQGTATRSFGGGIYILSVDATLPDPVNQNYAVWVTGGGSARLIDYMKGLGTSWSLTLRDKDVYSNYGSIWITLERTKDQKSEEHVMEGTF